MWMEGLPEEVQITRLELLNESSTIVATSNTTCNDSAANLR